MIEAVCGRCGETFIPHSEEPDDLVHGVREDGEECGGVGVVAGEWVRTGRAFGPGRVDLPARVCRCGGVLPPPVRNLATGRPNGFSYCEKCGQPTAWEVSDD